MLLNKLINKIFQINSISDFNALAIEIFHYQYNNNLIYHQFIDYNHFKLNEIINYKDIPFMPIEFFKTKTIICGQKTPEKYFESSGTTGIEKSKHYISSINTYEESFCKGFEYFYGNIQDYCLLAILPNYLEQQNSSLIYMIDKLIKKSNHSDSGFYLYDLQKLSEKLLNLHKENKKIILFGVSYALLDLAEKFPIHIPETIIFETGGMKGRRKEMIREELHHQLIRAFGVPSVHGEYGMTELLSQAYSKGNGLFKTPPWMKVLIRDTNDPYALSGCNKTGGINIIDLANIESCSFIATQDLGKLFDDGSFEVTGRFDNSEIRGCNLMIF